MATTSGAIKRFFGLGTAIGLALFGFSTAGYAGFQFDSAAPSARQMQQAPMAQSQSSNQGFDQTDSAMMAVPSPQVDAAPLDMPVTNNNYNASNNYNNTSMNDPVLPPAGAVSCRPDTAPPMSQRNSGNINHRQRAITPSDNEPVNTAALEDAVENGEPLALTADSPRLSQGNTSQRLTINPYPLESQTQVAPHNDIAELPVEQAMTEQGGGLRPVAVPGRTGASGMIRRANISARRTMSNDNNPAPSRAQPASLTSGDMMTPIPSGEVPMQQDAAMMQAPAMPAQQQATNSTRQRHAAAPVRNTMRSGAAPYPADQTESVLRIPASARGGQPTNIPIAPISPASQAPASTEASQQFAPAVGFGRDLPLALALSQVVPANYSYAFGQNVDTAANVSWQGGKPWNQVLSDMLAANGMKAVITNNQVVIQKANS